MSGSINKAILVANLGRDPELRHTQDGTPVANLSVATSQSWSDKHSGERREKTEWHRVTVWGKLAEIADKYCVKGTKVYLEGAIETRKWQDQSGQDRYTTEIVLRGYGAALQVLSGGRPPDSGEPEHPSDPARQGPSYPDLDEEIPF